MRFSAFFSFLLRLLIAPSVIVTLYLYLYPAAQRCAFPEPRCRSSVQSACEVAPFRLLALGDPQLEGDTSLPDPDAPLLPSLQHAGQRLLEFEWSGVADALEETVTKDLARLVQRYRKRLDLWGNDLYLAHIYRCVSWWTQPTHTVVLGDLLGSQWIGDGEFQRRTERFWNRVFKGAGKVPQSVTDAEGRQEVLGGDETWNKTIMAVVGNHDIGYAGDINEHRIQRFEDAYGRANWDIRFRLDINASASTPSPDTSLAENDPELHLIILNTMNLDDPAWDASLQQKSRDFLDGQLQQSIAPTTGTILLTHIPFHKKPGVCVDAPFFSYFPDDQGGGIKEQNHLSKHTTRRILNGLVRGRSVVLNGHDHEGCDTWHYRYAVAPSKHDDEGSAPWQAKRFATSNPERANESMVGLREITVRSMMGSFGGNAGLFSAWFNSEAGEWEYEYDVCVLGVQHFWWAVHVLDLVVIGLAIAWVLARIVETSTSRAEDAKLVVNGKQKKA